MGTANRWRGVCVGNFITGPWTGESAQIGVGGWVSDTDPNWTSPAIDTVLPTATVNPGGGIEVVGGLGTVNYGAEGSGASGFSKDNQKAIAAALVTFLNVIDSYQASSFKWQELRLSAFQADGAVINGATVITMNPEVPGIDSTHDFAPQTAIVQSLRTSGRGSRNRGRFYVPAHSSNSAATGGMVGQTIREGINTATKALWDTLEGLTHIGPAVVSPTHQTFSEVVQFAVGDRFDTQRRRAQGVREGFSTVAN